MEQFMLIFHSDLEDSKNYANQSPEILQAEMQKWSTWIGSIAAQGKMVSSEALIPTGQILSGPRHVLTDGPFTEGKEIVSGFLMLKATGPEDALEMAKGCPMLAANGRVEVRAMMSF